MSVLIKEVQPISANASTDTIISAVRNILQRPGIVRLVVDARRENIEFWLGVTDEEAAEKSISIHDMLRQVTMEEYAHPEKVTTSHEVLHEIFEMIEDAGCFPSHIITGAGPLGLRKWISMSRKSKLLFGVPIYYEGTMEKDVLVICGSYDREATAADVEYAVKVTLL